MSTRRRCARNRWTGTRSDPRRPRGRDRLRARPSKGPRIAQYLPIAAAAWSPWRSIITADDIADLLAPFSPDVRQIALDLRALIREVVPDAIEEVDPSARLVAFTFIPGTYKGLFVAVALHRSHVNLMFSKGVELLDVDTSGLLEGTGKRARHIKFRERARLDTPEVRALIASAAERTQRG